MSAITDRIDEYVAGDITFAALADFLTNFDWPTAEVEDPADPFAEMLTDGGDFPADGTFDEVTAARHRGKLTDDEFFTLLEAHNALT